MQSIISPVTRTGGIRPFFSRDDVKVAGIELLDAQRPRPAEPQVALSAIVRRDLADQMTDMLLDAGAHGVNMNHVRFAAQDALCELAGARINVEYTLLRCITSQRLAGSLHATVTQQAEGAGLNDACLFTQPVADVATYVPSEKEYRDAS